MPLVPEFMQGLVNQLHGMIGVIQNARAQKQPLDVIPAVKFNGELTHLIRRKGSPHHIIGTAVHTIFAIIDTLVGKQNLEKGNTTAVR